jgi:hypothetical protein
VANSETATRGGFMYTRKTERGNDLLNLVRVNTWFEVGGSGVGGVGVGGSGIRLFSVA